MPVEFFMRSMKTTSKSDSPTLNGSSSLEHWVRTARRNVAKLTRVEISTLASSPRGKRLLMELAETVDAGDKVEFEKWDDVPEAKLGPLTEAERRALDAPLTRTNPRKRRR